MVETLDTADLTLTHRVVTLGLAELAADGAVPAHAGEVVSTCNGALDAVEGDVLGRLAEADVTRALKELEAEGVVTATRESTSPTGKGRPRYELAVDADALLDRFADDERVAGLVDRVRTA
ncbi:MAG: hypothetical protein ABEJ85_02745 [Haloarculaceae archaeon]